MNEKSILFFIFFCYLNKIIKFNNLLKISNKNSVKTTHKNDLMFTSNKLLLWLARYFIIFCVFLIK